MSQRQTTIPLHPSLPRQPNDLPSSYWSALSAKDRTETGVAHSTAARGTEAARRLSSLRSRSED